MTNTERPSHTAARLLNSLRADRYIARNFADELFQLGSLIDAQDRIHALSHAAGQEAVAWRTIKPCGLRRHMTQAQYDANPSVQKWYEPFKCADCRAPAQPPASAEVGRDAERYRWLRKNAYAGTIFTGAAVPLNCDEPESEWDATIDAAMTASSGRKVGD